MTQAPSDRARAERFVALHQGSDLFVMANPTNVGTAVILEKLGYPALGTSSAALARAMGYVDGMGQVTREQSIAHAVEIHQATSIPISGDFENGFGDSPADVAATVRASIDAGLAGCCIEDSTSTDAGPIYDAGLARERIEAGAAEIGDAPFVLVARSENFLHGRPDLDDTIARLQSFEAAGAGALYAPGLITLDDIGSVVSSVGLPLNVLVGMPGQAWSLAELADTGVRRVSVGSGLERVANAALRSAAEDLAAATSVAEVFGHK